MARPGTVPASRPPDIHSSLPSRSSSIRSSEPSEEALSSCSSRSGVELAGGGEEGRDDGPPKFGAVADRCSARLIVDLSMKSFASRSKWRNVDRDSIAGGFAPAVAGSVRAALVSSAGRPARYRGAAACIGVNRGPRLGAERGQNGKGRGDGSSSH